MSRERGERFDVAEVKPIRRVHNDLLIIVQRNERDHVAALAVQVKTACGNAEAGGPINEGAGGFTTSAPTGSKYFSRSVAKKRPARCGETITFHILAEIIAQRDDGRHCVFRSGLRGYVSRDLIYVLRLAILPHALKNAERHQRRDRDVKNLRTPARREIETNPRERGEHRV